MAGRNAGAGAEVETRRDPAGPLDMSALTTIVGYPLRRAQLAVFDDFNRRFAALALTPAQFSTLALIGANPGRKQSEIAGALGIQRPNFVAMMDELERRGLAERLRTPADRRSRALALTPDGRGAGRPRAPGPGGAGDGDREADRRDEPRAADRRADAADAARKLNDAPDGETPPANTREDIR